MQTKITFIISLLMLATMSYGQGFFNQKGAMIKKCAQQIALLQTYTMELQSGYKTVENGISLTHDLKNGEFHLHNDYYTSLATVNPGIKKYPYVQQTISLYNKLLSVHTSEWQQAQSSGMLTAKELAYIKGVYTNLLKAASEDMEELKKLTTDGTYKLTDDERIQRIDAVYKRMQQKYKVITAFNARIQVITDGRQKQQQAAEAIKKLYGG